MESGLPGTGSETRLEKGTDRSVVSTTSPFSSSCWVKSIWGWITGSNNEWRAQGRKNAQHADRGKVNEKPRAAWTRRSPEGREGRGA